MRETWERPRSRETWARMMKIESSWQTWTGRTNIGLSWAQIFLSQNLSYHANILIQKSVYLPAFQMTRSWSRRGCTSQLWGSGGPPAIPADCTWSQCPRCSSPPLPPMCQWWGQLWHSCICNLLCDKLDNSSLNTYIVLYLSGKPISCVPLGLIRVVELMVPKVGPPPMR